MKLIQMIDAMHVTGEPVRAEQWEKDNAKVLTRVRVLTEDGTPRTLLYAESSLDVAPTIWQTLLDNYPALRLKPAPSPREVRRAEVWMERTHIKPVTLVVRLVQFQEDLGFYTRVWVSQLLPDGKESAPTGGVIGTAFGEAGAEEQWIRACKTYQVDHILW